MRENLEEKSLVSVNEESIFYKIKTFFINLFKRKRTVVDEPQTETITSNEVQHNKDNHKRDLFMSSIKNIENEETKLLKLQKQYDNGEIGREQLSAEQVKQLITLYKKQIKELSESNKKRRERLFNIKKMKNA